MVRAWTWAPGLTVPANRGERDPAGPDSVRTVPQPASRFFSFVRSCALQRTLGAFSSP